MGVIMDIEVLISAMNLKNEQEFRELIARSKITTKSLLINQVTKDDIEPFDIKEGEHRLLSFKEKGLSKSRNKALANSVGDIAILCDDDVIYVDNYEKIIKDAYEKNPDADIIAFYIESLNPKRRIRHLENGYVDFKKSLQILLDYHLSLKKNDGKIALMDLAVKDVELANKMDMIINVGEEDLLKYYPEVLAGDVKELVNRLVFLKKSEIPYKTQSHNKVVYQSFVLRQEVLDKVLEKHVELNEVLDKTETNNVVKELIKDENLIDELDKMDDNFEMVSNSYMDDYKDIIKLVKLNETENAYTIGDYYFSKNKVNRSINYLLSVFTEESNEQILLASLLHDSRLSNEDMQNVINMLGIKVK